MDGGRLGVGGGEVLFHLVLVLMVISSFLRDKNLITNNSVFIHLRIFTPTEEAICILWGISMLCHRSLYVVKPTTTLTSY